jgi:hypothetical protein
MGVQVPLGLANHQKLHPWSFKTPGLSFFLNIIPGGYQGKKEKEKVKSLALRLGTTWERGVPLHFLGDENEKGRKQ